MNEYIYLGLMLFLSGCDKEGILGFEQPKDCIQFNYSPSEGKMQMEYDFANQFTLYRDEYGNLNEYFLGDSIQRDTVSLNITLMGHAVDIDRQFRLKAVPVSSFDSLPMAPVEFSPSYTFRAGYLYDTVDVVLVRPAGRGRYAVGITFEREETGSFDSGAEEQSTYLIFVSDHYDKPDNWSAGEDALGEYSEEKYAFFITCLHQKFTPYLDWEYYNPYLREELERYNRLHPDKVKDFVFPVWTKPIWWDWWNGAGTYLGEFSEAKKAFVISVIGQENYTEYTDWNSFMPALKKAYDSYNEEHPDNPLPFPEFP